MTQGLGAVNLAGPARGDHGAGHRPRLRERGVHCTSTASAQRWRASCLILRIGFVGEVGYEIHFPSAQGEHLWDALMEAGREHGLRPFGLEPQRLLRLQKMHILVGQDTDSESHPFGAAMPWIVKLDKEQDFIGKWALERYADEPLETALVGITLEDGHVPTEGAAVMPDGESPMGQVTSARYSPQLGKVIGMAWVPAALAKDGAGVTISDNGKKLAAEVVTKPFYDPGRRGAALMSLEFLSPGAGAVARSPMERQALEAGARLELRDGWQVAASFDGSERERERLAQTVGFADSSQLGKIEIQAAPGDLAAIAAGAGAAGLALGRATRSTGAWWCPYARRAIVLCEPEDTAELHQTLDGAARATAGRATVLDVTPSSLRSRSRARWRVRRSRASRRSTCARRRCRCAASDGSVARTPGAVLREDEDRFLMLFGAALGQYVWTVVADAAEALGGGPVGVDALEPLDDPLLEVTPWCVTSSAGAACAQAAGLKDSYDVVIIGGGSHGLANRLLPRARPRRQDVAILEKSYIGSGAAGQHDDPALELQDRGGRALLRRLGQALRGALAGAQLQPAVLAERPPDTSPTDRAMFVMANRAEVNRLNGSTRG